MLSNRNPSSVWQCLSFVFALVFLVGNLAPQIVRAESVVQSVPLVEFEDTGFFTRIHPTKMALGKDRKIYFNTSLGIVYRVDGNGVLEEVAVLPNAGGVPEDDFTVGMTFNRAGELFVSNLTGIYMIRKQDLRPHALERSVSATKVVSLPVGLQVPMGLVADTRGNLYLSDMLAGSIYKVNIDEGSITLWFSDPELMAPNVFPSNNLFGVGFGLTDLAIGQNGKYLYFGTQESHKIYRLGIEQDGLAGELEELAHVPGLAFNGISFDMVDKKVYLAVPWKNFENGIQVEENKVEVAGSIWMIDIHELDEDESATPVELISDVDLGTAVDVVRGFGVGVRSENIKLYVSDGSFDTFFWFNGDPNGAPFPPDINSEPGVPFPMNRYHGAIRMIELDD